MIQREEADAIAREHIRKLAPPDHPFALVEKGTMERAFGWVYFYNSKEFLETGNNLCRLAGNGPIYVRKDTGEPVDLGTQLGAGLLLIQKYEQNLEKSKT